MEKKPYHHKNLKNDLIEKGIELVNKNGINQLSLRKVAQACGVSHAAPYSHFSNKEELLQEMQLHITKKFTEVLENTVSQYRGTPIFLLEFGKAYISFFISHPQYFNFLFQQGNIQIDLNIDSGRESNYQPFAIYKEQVLKLLADTNMTQSKKEDLIVALFAYVQGLTTLATMENVHYAYKWEDKLTDLKEQLEDAQKLMGRMEQYIVEARGVLQSCIRRQSEFQYAYLGDMIQETAKTSERLTDKLRRLTFEIVVNPKEYEKYKEDLVLIHGIELEYKDEILRVSAPVLIPHRKDCYTDYLYKPLHTAFRNWCMQRAEEKLEIPTYTNCTICFVHVYDETLPLARVRDHDNYEEKHVQDIITNFFLRSDSGLYTNTCHVTRMGEEDRTLLYVMDSSKFPAWISDFGKETGIEKNHE